MREIINLEYSLKNSKKIKLLKKVFKRYPTKSVWPRLDDNFLELTYHSVLTHQKNRELNLEDIEKMEKILSEIISKPIDEIETLEVEYDTYNELSELRGVYCEYSIPVGIRKTSRILTPEAKEYLKGIHSVWREKTYEDELTISIRVNLFANKTFFNKTLRGD